MGLTKDTDSGGIATGSSSSGKYYIYSSDAGKTPGENVQILAPQTSTDKFVSSLKNKVIILEAKPNPVADFDSSDEWSKWFTKFAPTAKLSLKVDDTTALNIQAFECKVTDPWNIKFSSSTDALNFSFGPPAAGAGPARIPVPGLSRDGSMLYCGIDHSEIGVLKSTVKNLFEYVGLADRVSSLPSSLSGSSVTLDGQGASNNHNALWFNPSFSFQTTVRLQFQLDIATLLQDFLNSALPGLEIRTTYVICKKVVVPAEAESGPVSVDQGQVMFSVQCSLTTKGNPVVNMILGIEVKESLIKLTFKLGDQDSLWGILLWLGGLISEDLSSVKDLFTKDKAFEGFNLRQMTIGLETAENTEKPKLSNFKLVIEVSTNFGRGPDLKPVVFLVTYTWTKGGGKLGSIRGQLWTCKHIPKLMETLNRSELTSAQGLTSPWIKTLVHTMKVGRICNPSPSQCQQPLLASSQ